MSDLRLCNIFDETKFTSSFSWEWGMILVGPGQKYVKCTCVLALHIDGPFIQRDIQRYVI